MDANRTIRDHTAGLKAHLLPAFGARELESITRGAIEAWRRTLPMGLSARRKNKLLIELHGIFRRAQVTYGLDTNPLSLVEKHPLKSSDDIQVFSPEEVCALVRAAASEQDAAVFLTAVFTGLRLGELLALRWWEVDFPGSVIRVRRATAWGS